MRMSLGLGVLLAITLGATASAGADRASAARPLATVVSTPTLSTSRLLLHGRVRCTASVAPEVEVGQAVSVGLTLRNLSKRSVKISVWVFSAGLVLHAADGTTYDTSATYEGLPGIPPPTSSKLRARATRHLGPIEIPVRWNGPLRITPVCLGKPLPALQVGVTAPGPPSDDGTAIADVVAASGHLLDLCRPEASGVPVDGQINPPAGDVPPMYAQCSISLTSEGSFSVAQVLVVTPSGLPGVQIYQPYETLWPNGHLVALASGPSYEAIAWEFVVTQDGAVPVAAATQVASKDSSQMAPSFGWHGTDWEQDGTGTCGGTGFAWGGIGPSIEFISACPA